MNMKVNTKTTISHQSLPKINEKKETGKTVSNFKAFYNVCKLSVFCVITWPNKIVKLIWEKVNIFQNKKVQ